MSEHNARNSAPARSPPDDGETRPLPNGWIKQYDSNSKAWFYVDTKASPPRSIWLHPHDDPQYIEAHRDVKSHEPSYQPPSSPPPVSSSSKPRLSQKRSAPEKRGFFGKLKDKAIGTKEEREAAKRLRERERKERLALQQAHAAQYGAPPQFYQEYPQQGQVQPYGPGGPYGPGPHGPGQTVYVQQPQRSGFGGGMAMPLLGGVAGGLLLGSMLGGDGGDFGGDFGGGF